MAAERIVIVGAGIAGAATAWQLARRPGAREILILEREADPGSHSTGRNAAILRSNMPDPVLGALAADAVPFFRRPPPGFAAGPLLDPVGLFLAAAAADAPALRAWAVQPRIGAREVPVAELYRAIPALAPGLDCAIYQGDEGVVDVHALLHGFLRGAHAAGAQLRLVTPALRLVHDGKRVIGLDTPQGRIPADQVLLAGGGWASAVADAAGVGLPLVPYRRHILVTEPLAQVDPRWPVLWIAGDEFYFRPESGGLMMSACDATPLPPDQGELVDRGELERIARKAQRWLPRFAGAGAAHFWAGMRTYAPDERFVIGPDPRLSGLHWCAGLAGHGITCAPAAGALAADWLAAGASRHPAAAALLPARLIAAPAASRPCAQARWPAVAPSCCTCAPRPPTPAGCKRGPRRCAGTCAITGACWRRRSWCSRARPMTCGGSKAPAWPRCSTPSSATPRSARRKSGSSSWKPSCATTYAAIRSAASSRSWRS